MKNPSQKLAFKNRLKLHGITRISQRIETLAAVIARAQEAANFEEKSSAGDKYETSRAMNQNEKEMYSRQLAETRKELSTLEALAVQTISRKVAPGTVVRCDALTFFVAAGLGKQKIDGEDILFISPLAPITRQLMDKFPGDHITFNQKQFIIREIF